MLLRRPILLLLTNIGPAKLVDRELVYIVGRADGLSAGRSEGRTVGRSDGRSDGRTDGRFGAIFDHLGSILCHPGSPKSPQTYRLIPRGPQSPNCDFDMLKTLVKLHATRLRE